MKASINKEVKMSDELITEEIKQLRQLIEELREEKKRFSEAHDEEHEYLRRLIEKDKIKKEILLDMRKKLASGGMWAVLVVTASAIGLYAKTWLGS